MLLTFPFVNQGRKLLPDKIVEADDFFKVRIKLFGADGPLIQDFFENFIIRFQTTQDFCDLVLNAF